MSQRSQTCALTPSGAAAIPGALRQAPV